MRSINGTFPIQELVLEDAMAGRDVLARSRTGSGKTLAFAIPIVEGIKHNNCSPAALILVPTRELASQVTEEFRTIAEVKHLSRRDGATGASGSKDQAQRAAKADIVIATPGRLLDLIRRKMLNGRACRGLRCWTRPTACSTWGSFPTSARSCRCCPRSVRR